MFKVNPMSLIGQEMPKRSRMKNIGNFNTMIQFCHQLLLSDI